MAAPKTPVIQGTPEERELAGLFTPWILTATRQSPNFTEHPEWLEKDARKLFFSKLSSFVRGLNQEDVEDLLSYCMSQLIVKSWSRKSQWIPEKGRKTMASWMLLGLSSTALNWTNQRRRMKVSAIPFSALVTEESIGYSEAQDAIVGASDPPLLSVGLGPAEEALLSRIADLLEHELRVSPLRRDREFVRAEEDVKLIIQRMRSGDQGIVELMVDPEAPTRSRLPGWCWIGRLLEPHRESLLGG